MVYDVLNTSYSSILRYNKRRAALNDKLDACCILVDQYRQHHPGGGLRKIYYRLRYRLNDVLLQGISRDRFIEGAVARGRLINMAPPLPKTTRSGLWRFENLTPNLVVHKCNQLWVCDTTYYRMASGEFHYITFILDAFSRLIVGYAVSRSLKADANIAALQQAIELRGPQCLIDQDVKLIFHSDGGGQFIDLDFIDTLRAVTGRSSMGLIAQENAQAERINGTIKNEYLSHFAESRQSFNKLELCCAKAVDHYNRERLHNALPAYASPVEFEHEYAAGLHQDHSMKVFEWDHALMASTDRLTATQPLLKAAQKLTFTTSIPHESKRAHPHFTQILMSLFRTAQITWGED